MKDNSKKNRWAVIPSDIYMSENYKQLSTGARALLFVLLLHRGKNNGAWLAQKTLCEHLNATKNSIKKYTTELRQHNFIKTFEPKSIKLRGELLVKSIFYEFLF